MPIRGSTRNSQRNRYRNLSRRKEGRNELEGKLRGFIARGKEIAICYVFSRGGIAPLSPLSEFEISPSSPGPASHGQSSRSSARIPCHFCKVNSDASSPPNFRQTRKATRFPPTLHVFTSPLWNFTCECLCVCIESIRKEGGWERYLVSFVLFPYSISFWITNGRRRRDGRSKWLKSRTFYQPLSILLKTGK